MNMRIVGAVKTKSTKTRRNPTIRLSVCRVKSGHPELSVQCAAMLNLIRLAAGKTYKEEQTQC